MLLTSWVLINVATSLLNFYQKLLPSLSHALCVCSSLPNTNLERKSNFSRREQLERFSE